MLGFLKKDAPMLASEFEKFVNLQGPSIISLKGAISHKSVPQHITITDLDELPPALSTPIGALVGAHNWKTMRDDVWSLPDAAEQGTIIPIKTGQQYIYIDGNWYLLATANV